LQSVKVNEIRADATKAEKATMMVENGRKSASVLERELTDGCIAHKVRNPLSAAMAASVFLSSAVCDEKTSLADFETRKSIQEDTGAIDASLNIIHDLLRNTLDMNRASGNQLRIDLAHADLLRDVLEPLRGFSWNYQSPYLYCSLLSLELLGRQVTVPQESWRHQFRELFIYLFARTFIPCILFFSMEHLTGNP
jgi:signal transduction histidine kinase